jgi:hypothetical protein
MKLRVLPSVHMMIPHRSVTPACELRCTNIMVHEQVEPISTIVACGSRQLRWFCTCWAAVLLVRALQPALSARVKTQRAVAYLLVMQLTELVHKCLSKGSAFKSFKDLFMRNIVWKPSGRREFTAGLR